MKPEAVLAVIAGALGFVVAVIALTALTRQRKEAQQPSTVADVTRIRELLFAVDRRAQWVAWLTLVNAVVTLVAAWLAFSSSGG
ncbi:hypothetical protein G4Z16_15520 [Streptomyces bathyalis]|uniref:Uncharacterized protein n=1 Tax=Streptomyces bathyalis TaxID=2710756 RepID=A0A7T1T704_9ACTN|nr:hypothetical protein [Streptomyces bathyalis]QPP07565.1 hypothetical protein G4Z16_15520 [Streptomyces bathyalis]